MPLINPNNVPQMPNPYGPQFIPPNLITQWFPDFPQPNLSRQPVPRSMIRQRGCGRHRFNQPRGYVRMQQPKESVANIKCPTDFNESIGSLTSGLTSVVSEIPSLEKKLDDAKAIQMQLDSLTKSKEYFSPEDFQTVKTEIESKGKQVSSSKIIKIKILDIQEKISELQRQLKILQTSPDYLSNKQVTKLQGEIKEREIKMNKGAEIQQKIDDLKKSKGYLNENQQKSISEALKKSKQVLSSLQQKNEGESVQDEFASMLNVQEKVKRELECSICLEIPSKNKNVFSCLSSHLVCNDCQKRNLATCPVCKQDFKKMPIMRNLLAEKMIANLD